MGTERKWSDRDEVREGYDCPRCGAEAGFHCRGTRGKLRVSNHAERVAEHEATCGSIDAFYREGGRELARRASGSGTDPVLPS